MSLIGQIRAKACPPSFELSATMTSRRARRRGLIPPDHFVRNRSEFESNDHTKLSDLI
jgi:hypothetical protein